MFDDALRQFFTVQTLLGIQTAAIILFVLRMWNGSPAMFAQWIAYRKARAEEKAADWERIRQERDVASEALKVSREEIDLLRDRLADVEAKRIDALGRAVRAEAALQGYGDGRQRLAAEEAERRLGSDGRGGK